MADVTVTGAGTSAANGIYTQSGTTGGKPRYVNGSWSIFWDDTAFFGQWVMGQNGRALSYYSDDDTATPDLVTTWQVNSGIGLPPPPAVSKRYTMSADPASYTITATDADLRATRTMQADSAASQITAMDAGLSAGRYMAADPASTVTTPTDAELKRGLRLAADSIATTTTPSDVTLTYTQVGHFVVVADSAATAIGAGDVSLAAGRRVQADAASYQTEAMDADLKYGRVLQAGLATYEITAGDAGFLRGYALQAGSAAYILTGGVVNLSAGTIDESFAPPLTVTFTEHVRTASFRDPARTATFGNSETSAAIADPTRTASAAGFETGIEVI
jgi:hypothetical protein